VKTLIIVIITYAIVRGLLREVAYREKEDK